MFTGLVEEVGKIKNMQRKGDFLTISVDCKSILDDVKLGDSIAINGVCLTVVEFSDVSFTVEAVKETIDRTSLSELKISSKVNLERALKASDRLGGHFVLGHVDTVGIIRDIRKEEKAVILNVQMPEKYDRYLIEKGSITIDGISLTVASLVEGGFTCSIIPHTWAGTTLEAKAIGQKVNLECDVLGKYVEKFISPYSSKSGGMTEEWLRKMGY